MGNLAEMLQLVYRRPGLFGTYVIAEGRFRSDEREGGRESSCYPSFNVIWDVWLLKKLFIVVSDTLVKAQSRYA